MKFFVFLMVSYSFLWAEGDFKKNFKSQEKKGDFSGLTELFKFKNIAVIQKRYLPKTKRLEVSPAGFVIMNNSFFISYGVGANVSYYFKEKLGVEFTYQKYFRKKRGILKNVERENRNAQSTHSDQFVGGSIKWTPIYGKMAWLNKSIIPFDLGFNIGAGLVKAKYTIKNVDKDFEELTKNALGFTASMNQVFALSQSLAFRWDLGLMHYNFKKDDGGAKVKQTDVYAGAGISFFLPGVKRR